MFIKKFISFTIVLSLFFISGCSSNEQQIYLDYAQNYQPEDEFTKYFYENVVIDIKDIKTESEQGTIKVKIPDLKTIYEAHYDEIIAGQNKEDIQKVLLQNMNEYTIELSIVTDLVKEDKIWKVQSTEQIDEAISDMIDDFLYSVLSDVQFDDISMDLHLEEIQ